MAKRNRDACSALYAVFRGHRILYFVGGTGELLLLPPDDGCDTVLPSTSVPGEGHQTVMTIAPVTGSLTYSVEVHPSEACPGARVELIVHAHNSGARHSGHSALVEVTRLPSPVTSSEGSGEARRARVTIGSWSDPASGPMPAEGTSLALANVR